MRRLLIGRQTPSSHSENKLIRILSSTDPVAEVGRLFLLLPVWWILGIEQFIWPVGLAWIAGRILLAKRRDLTIPLTLKLLFVFLLAYLLSGLFIVEPVRWLTFLRNFGAYLAPFLLVLIVVNSVSEWEDIELLLRALACMIVLASMVGFLGVLGVWHPVFKSVLGRFLPSWILNTTYGRHIAYRSIGHYANFIMRRYFRVYSFFIFSTLYASALAFSLPMFLFLHAQARTVREKFLLKGSIALLLVNLVFTTGRAAWLSLLFGAFYYLAFVSARRSLFRRFMTYLVVALLLALLVGMLLSHASVEVVAGLGRQGLERFVFARADSLSSRLTIYKYTLEGFLQRPVFGWGTERDVAETRFPAGSHSYYLAILYRHGIVGFLALLGVLCFLWKDTRPPIEEHDELLTGLPTARLLRYGRWIFVTALVDGLTTVPLTDTTTMVTLWLIFSVLIASSYLHRTGTVLTNYA